MTVSPDGQHIVFERTTDPVFDPTSSLWIMNRDGTGLHMLIDDAGRPAWGPGDARGGSDGGDQPERDEHPAQLDAQPDQYGRLCRVVQ